MRNRIGIVLCVLVLWGGSVWAQPGPRDQAATWTSWGHWAETVKSWVSQAWTSKPIMHEGIKAETGSVKVEKPTGSVSVDGICTPPPGWQSCSADPDG